MSPEFDGERLTLGPRQAPAASIQGFVERYGSWTGRAWMEIRGPGWVLPIHAGYGADRARLRRWFPDRPFQSDWDDGRFPPTPAGLPGSAVFGAALAGCGLAAAAAGWAWGAIAGLGIAIAALWPLSRLRDGALATDTGLRLGPVWAPEVPWHEVDSVVWRRTGRALQVSSRGAVGAGTVHIPAVLLPAFRARVRRLGGLEVAESTGGLDDRYHRWRAPAAGTPWGILAGTLAAAWWASHPWYVLAIGLLCVAATALLGAAVEARATGWGAGGVLWFTGVYAVVLVACSLGLWWV